MNAKRMLYIVVCAAGPAADVGNLVTQAKIRDWAVQIISTPSALSWLDVPALQRQTGYTVRSIHRETEVVRSRHADAAIVAPASFNTINKLALGIADNYALDVLHPMISRKTPLVVLPFVNIDYACRAPFISHVNSLRAEGVSILIGEGGFVPHAAGTGDGRREAFPWTAALEKVEQLLAAQASTKP